MTALPRAHHRPLSPPAWLPEVTQLLDEHHLVATAADPALRAGFSASLARFLGNLEGAEVCTLYGRFITDLDSLCYQVERAIPAHTPDRRIDGPRGLTSLLRARPPRRTRTSARYRFYLWNDADTLLHADRDLFRRAVDAIAGVAAESEYACDDLLLLHRLVAVGGHALSVHAADPQGAFQSWYDDGGGEPFWQVVTGVEAPPFMGYDIEPDAPQIVVPRIS